MGTLQSLTAGDPGAVTVGEIREQCWHNGIIISVRAHSKSKLNVFSLWRSQVNDIKYFLFWQKQVI